MFLESFLYFYYFVFFLPVNLLLHIIGNISHPRYFQKCLVLCILSHPIIQYPYNTVLNKAFKSCVTFPSMQFDLNSFLQKSVFASFIVGLYSQIFYKRAAVRGGRAKNRYENILAKFLYLLHFHGEQHFF